MLKKSLLFGFLSATFCMSAAFCQEFSAMAMPEPSIPAEKISQEAQPSEETASATLAAGPQNAVQLERGGVDRASVHLQILQQTTPHFAETAPAKKAAVNEKKAQVKAASNS